MNGPIFDNRDLYKNDRGIMTKTGLHLELLRQNRPFQIEQLKIADCALSQKACLENKNISKSGNHDLEASLHDDRIHEQSEQRKNNYDWNGIIIMIEKGAQFYTPFFTPMHWDSLRFTLITQFESHIFIVNTEEEKVKLIYNLYEKFKEGEYHVDPTNKTPRPNPKQDYNNQLYFLSGLFDIGKDKAKALLDHFTKPILIIKWIVKTQIRFTKGGNPKISETSVKIPGFGPKFFLKNQKMLLEVAKNENKL